MSLRECLSIEESVDLAKFTTTTYTQTIRDYIYCRDNGLRIALERRFDDYIDPDNGQLDFDCFNRYKFECYIHIEYEFNKCADVQLVLQDFLQNVCGDEVIYSLLAIMSNKNLNFISDEIINIKNMSLTHNYSHCNVACVDQKKMEFFALKYDGARKNFCIFNKYLQVDGKCFEFENHWFGQIIIGHCEILDNGTRLVIIDVYLIAENFHKIAKKYNISYTGALQNYHNFCTAATTLEAGSNKANNSLKTQDEYFHMKRLGNTIKYMQPIEAINAISLLKNIWKNEPKIAHEIKLQKFYENLAKVQVKQNKTKWKTDGILGFTNDKIYKIKTDLTIDMVFKFDEMFRFVMKKMKKGHQDLKKMIKYRNIQKTLNWLEFEKKYTGKFNRYVVDFLYFANQQLFSKLYPNWRVHVDLDVLEQQLNAMQFTFFIVLLEFHVDTRRKLLVFTRVRDDKFSANSVKVFRKILKQMVVVSQ